MSPTQIKVEMARKGLTGHAVARDLGFSAKAGYVNKIARGAIPCSTGTALTLARMLGIPMLRLFKRDDSGELWAIPAEKRNGISGVGD